MYPTYFLLCLTLGTFVQHTSGSDWCYNGCAHTPEHWVDISGSFCGGTRQSPIDIDTSKVVTHDDLHDFSFVNFSSQHAIKSFINNGHTVKLKLEDNMVEVSGGGLNGTYSALQFHFHWGDTVYHPGSEHTMNGHKYPMEMHIVTIKKGLSVDEAKKDPHGIAALGFFINETENVNHSGPWSMLTSYLTNITDTEVEINQTFSIDDLIGNVDRTKFYRYYGSLTTPDCNEAVVWTVFHEPIQVNKDLVRLFPRKAGFTNTFRPTQPLNKRHVYASKATPLPPSHSWCYDSHCSFSPSQWSLLPDSSCGGKRQSPVNIETAKVVKDNKLTEFIFKNFDNKHAIKYITNTGHAVKCVLKDNMVEVSGGGLGHTYSCLQFHFHWGSHNSSGSEHTMDSKRYPMEMHIVNKRKDLTLEEAINTPNGLAVLGFFIESGHGTKSSSGDSGHGTTHPSSSSTSDMTAWKKLTSYLLAIQNISSQVDVTEDISIDDLLGGVKRKVYYRYNGSLTTPSCNEAVVWSVFKDTIKMDQNLMMMFPTYAGYHDVYRPVQLMNERTVFTSASCVPAPITVALLLLACLSAFFV